jgi:hypothetical protein
MLIQTAFPHDTLLETMLDEQPLRYRKRQPLVQVFRLFL